MDLVAIVLANLLLLPFIYLLPFEPVRVGLGALLVVFSPGYGLISALFPRRGRLDGVERPALGFGLSLALVPLLGLAIHFGPWSLSLTPIVVILTVWTLALTGIAWRRRQAVESEERFGVGWPLIRPFPFAGLRPIDLAVRAGLILLVLGATGAIAWKVQSSGSPGGFTEFYILGATWTLEDYPTTLRIGREQGYNVGIINRERRSIGYTIRAYLDNAVAGSVGPLTLSDGENWEGRIWVTPLVEGTRQRLEMRLFRDDQSDAYQRVYISVDVLPLSQPGG